MKNKKREKLHLNKRTIQNLGGHPDRLESDEQKAVKGGIKANGVLTTVVPYIC